MDAGDQAALCLKGRLLKDAASRANGAERRDLLAKAVDAYAAAARCAPATYPLINAATLALLAGDAGRAARLAGETLALLESGAHEPDTLYWLGATKAEALLLLGRETEARAALRQAVAGTPRAWEDHAVTLRQFRLILAEQHRPAAWLDGFLPPPAVHFAGPIGIAADAALGRVLEQAVATLCPGTATGALAAGFDIVAAEILVRSGAQLHLVLPGRVQDFIGASVRPFGADWVTRFERVAAEAASIETVAEAIGPCTGSVALAEEMALGLAVCGARLRDAEPVLLRMAHAPRPYDEKSRLRVLAVPGHSVAEPDLALLPAAPAAPVAILGGGPDLAEAFARAAPARVQAFASGAFVLLDDLAEAAGLAAALHAEAPLAALGLDYALVGSEAAPDLARLEALLQMPVRGYPVATRAAALALDSRARGFKTAIAGESETGAGLRFEFFSLWRDAQPVTPPAR